MSCSIRYDPAYILFGQTITACDVAGLIVHVPLGEPPLNFFVHDALMNGHHCLSLLACAGADLSDGE